MRDVTMVSIMGIVNVTPDSFSDGGHYYSPQGAIEHGLKLRAEGAHWLDIGGESARPGATPVSEAEELRRVVPVVRGLREAGVTHISIDTTKPAVAAAALSAGARLVNDIMGLSDPEMVRVVTRAEAQVCVMHMQGVPATMQASPQYHDVVAEVVDWLESRVAASRLPRAQVIVDPGIGFGKTFEHNQALLRGLASFRRLGCRVLVGVSRKSFIGAALGGKPAEARLVGSAAAVAILAARGQLDVVRVHDVQATVDALAIARAL
jgi:dihydropteroate synthase